MIVSKESPKFPKILNHDQFSKHLEDVKETREDGPEIIKLLINNKEVNIQEEDQNIEQDENSMEFDEEEMECGGLYKANNK